MKPGAGQGWLSHESLQKVRRFEHRKDGWWSLQVNEPHRIVHCGVEMDGGHIGSVRCPYGAPGDALWVREAVALDYFSASPWLSPKERHGYRADWTRKAADTVPEPKWRPSLLMPRWASRITLPLVEVRVERLQDITEEAAKAEGVAPWEQTTWTGYDPRTDGYPTFIGETAPDWMAHPRIRILKRSAREGFQLLWDSINAERATWASNPWVWVLRWEKAEVAHG